AGLGSTVAAAFTVAVFWMAVRSAVAHATLTAIAKPATSAGAIVAFEHSTVPPTPTGGEVHTHPAGVVWDTNVVPAGSGSRIVTVTAVFRRGSEPLLVATIA